MTDANYDKRSQEYWDRFFLDLAKQYSTASRDPSTKVGAVITDGKYFLSAGYNGFPQGIKDTKERYENREIKYAIVNHAEINALLSAKRDIEGCFLYTYPFAPCIRCCCQFIQAKIRRVVAPILPDNLKERWEKDMKMTAEYLEEAGIELVLVDYK